MTSSEPVWGEAVRGLARRVAGAAGASILLRERAGRERAGRSFSYEAADGCLTIEATDANAACVGLHDYLRRACGVSVGWDTPLPLDLLALPDAKVARQAAEVDETYYLNFCTFSYTMPYWDWPDWEREIDWMALHGVTMPLMVVGHEATLLQTYSSLGMQRDDVLQFLGGPGYLPFQYMGCLDSFGGRLTDDWIEAHAELARSILARQRALGMRPVLPAFTGHVPRQVAPDSASSREWQGLQTWFLDPGDPLYRKIAGELTRAQIALFGTDHLYAADPFIEMPPVDAGASFPAAVAAATLDGLLAADPRATWVLQSWPFSYQREFWTDERVSAFLDAIDDDHLLLLDLWADREPQWERFGGFGGKRWLWCALDNFGGRTDMVGDLDGVRSHCRRALTSRNRPAGIGLTMEGTRNNPALFEFVTDLPWRTGQDAAGWVSDFSAHRYGVRREDLQLAWADLLATVYDGRTADIFPERFQGVVTTAPSYELLADPGGLRERLAALVWYDHDVLVRGWERMLSVAEDDPPLAAGVLGHDLVDVAASALLRVADALVLEVVERSVAGERPDLERFPRLLDDLDRLLSTRPEFTFAAWEDKAARWDERTGGHSALDNARRILTVWNDPRNPALDDYAGRAWAGLVGDYYRGRWELWGRGLGDALSGLDEAERRLHERLAEHAAGFLANGASPRTAGDVVGVSRAVFDRYRAFPVVDRPHVEGRRPTAPPVQNDTEKGQS